jgi:hypothetical protein
MRYTQDEIRAIFIVCTFTHSLSILKVSTSNPSQRIPPAVM